MGLSGLQRYVATFNARSLLGLLIALSLGIVVFEAAHVTWGSQAMRGVRRSMGASLFHVPNSKGEGLKQEDMDQGKEVDPSDLLHVSLLQEVCVNSGDVIIPWQYGRPRSHGLQDSAEDKKLLLQRNDPLLLHVLKNCPDVDVFLPAGLRSHGYCEDGVVYTKCKLAFSLFSRMTDMLNWIQIFTRGCCQVGSSQKCSRIQRPVRG